MTIVRRARKRARQAKRALRAEYIAHCRRQPVDARAVLYESFAGNGALCNPEALFRAALAAPDLGHLHHIWALDDLGRDRAIIGEFAGDPRVRFVKRLSREYWMALATSGYLINNATFPPDFGKRPGQTYLNTWHGTPLKRMGYDMPHGVLGSANIIRNFLAADYLLSQSAWMTERMYSEAYRLDNLYAGRILEVGYPRVDHQFVHGEARGRARERLKADGLDLDGRRFVVFAPTWRGEDFASPRDETAVLGQAVGRLQQKLGDDVVVGLKTHQVVHRFAAGVTELAGQLVPNDIPTNVLLGLADVIVTDYSSVFFDGLATDLPIAFYTPPVDDYETGRGLYVEPSELPGPVATDIDALAAGIGQLLDGGGDDTWRERREEWRDRYTPDDDGHAAERVIDVLYRGVDLPGRVKRLDRNVTKQRILIHVGGMRSNGITTSVLNLLNAIDYDRYDVTTIQQRPKNPEQAENHARIDPRARHMVRFGGMNGSKLAHVIRRLNTRAGRAHRHRENHVQRTLWDDEWERCFGDAHFDVVIDFSGYSPFWATLLLHSPSAVRAIWLHSDLAAEARVKAHMRRQLRALGDLYSDFDRVVSVSAALNEINRRSFPASDTGDRFMGVRNVMDTDIVERSRAEVDDPATQEYLELLRAPDRFWFISIGRYSIEKNQERMLRAFARVHAQRPHARLMIVGGYGGLRDHLREVALELGIAEAVMLGGRVPDASPLIAAAGGFVLSSDWEGQPMVLMEAAALNRPIVSVEFGSAADALAPGQMRLVARDVGALAEGMLAMADGEVPAAHLDVGAYNADALAEFERAITPDA